MRVTVVGAGVVGLLAAHELAHRGHDVTVVAREVGAATTSARAGASFKPSKLARGPHDAALLRSGRDLLDRWTASGFADALGIATTRHVEASVRPLVPRDYLDVMRGVRELSAAAGDAIPGGYPHAVAYDTFFFDVPVTLAALAGHLDHGHGVTVAEADVTALDAAPVAATAPGAVVNATGLGARELAGDAEVVPVKGQTVLVRVPGPPPDFALAADGLYLYPRRDGVLLGGTAEPGVEDTAADPGTTQLLVAANARVLPALLDAEVVEARAGLRPYRRGGVRLEVDAAGPVPVVHAYGHGGAGWTLGPGSARWVADAVDGLGR